MGGKFSCFLRNSLWAKAANTATLQENNLTTKSRDLSPFEPFLGNYLYHETLMKFEIWPIVITVTKQNSPSKAQWEIWVEFADGHPDGTLHVLNPKHKKIIITFMYTTYPHHNCTSQEPSSDILSQYFTVYHTLPIICVRCTDIMEIKNTNKHDSAKLRGWNFQFSLQTMSLLQVAL